MIFTSLQFLSFFIILIALFAVIRGKNSRRYLLLIASYIFYGAWSPHYLILISACSVWGWWLGLLMNNSNSDGKRKFYLLLSLMLSLGMLAYYKYANFFAANISAALGLEWHQVDILLPVGISFFTFQTMSYTIDLYRGNIHVCRDLGKFMLFVAFFPQLVAGPIVRASEFLPQLEKRIRLSPRNSIIGLQLFLGGALQKILVADNLSTFVDSVFNEPTMFSAGTLWLALLAYTIQIFCDFSGYSLMAIGVAKILGFELPVNFRMPYISRSITEFWRRWHISLSFWLRDYLYISLGGNRKGVTRTNINLMLTMLLGGLWHGSSWNFVLWGGLHGMGLVGHKYWIKWQHPLRDDKVYSLFAWAATFLFVMLLWIPFRAKDFSTTIAYLGGLTALHGGVNWPHSMSIMVLSGILVWHLLYVTRNEWLNSFPSAFPVKAIEIYPILISLMLILLFAPLNTSPFIYFQF